MDANKLEIMTYKEAYSTLQSYQKWRLGNTDVVNFSTAELTKALDIAINLMEPYMLDPRRYCSDCKHLMPGNQCIRYNMQIEKPRSSWCDKLEKR